jgi:crossover junction endodeoxyribonuclease RuvC
MSKIILGFDPGTEITGWALLKQDGPKVGLLNIGIIRTAAKESVQAKLGNLLQEVFQLIEQFHPDEIVVETQYVGINPKSALTVAMARGVILAGANIKKIGVFEYAPSEAKRGITGKGNATKQQVQKMCSLIFGRSFDIPLDATDALALAYCHSNRLKIQKL